MTIPEKSGMRKLSSILMGNSSMNIAANAPLNFMISLMSGKNKPIIKQAIRPTMEPSNVLFQILSFPNFLPYRAAAVSPIAVNNNARTAISFGNIKTEIKRLL